MSRKIVARTGFTAANDATDLNQVGTVMDDASNGKSYRYIRVEDLALAANDAVEFADATGTEVTQDRAGGSSIGRTFAGVAVSTLTDAYYGWVQIKGVATCQVEAGAAVGTTVPAGSRVTTHATANGSVAAYSATTSSIDYSFGVALSADTATTSTAGTVTVMLDL